MTACLIEDRTSSYIRGPTVRRAQARDPRWRNRRRLPEPAVVLGHGERMRDHLGLFAGCPEIAAPGERFEVFELDFDLGIRGAVGGAIVGVRLAQQTGERLACG